MDKEILKQLNYHVNKVLENYPGLSVRYQKEIPTEVFGNFRIMDDEGVLQGDFDIKVFIPTTYPKGFPALYETSKKIERIAVRHIDKDGCCCVEINQQILLIRNRGITLQEFFKRYVHKFFCWQLIYEAEGPKALEQWDHGEKGVKQFYYKLLRCDNNTVVRKCIEAILNSKIPGRKELCICGSGKIAKKCHDGDFYYLQQIGNNQLLKDLKIFLK